MVNPEKTPPNKSTWSAESGTQYHNPEKHLAITLVDGYDNHSITIV